MSWLVVTAALAATDARGELDALRQELSAGALLGGEGAERLERARSLLARADARASSPVLAPARLLPVAGRQLRSFSAIVTASRTSLDIGLDVLAAIEAELAGGLPVGPARAALFEEVNTLLRDAAERLDAVDLGPDRAIIEPLAETRDELAAEMTKISAAVRDAGAVADVLAGMLRGPQRHLVLVANNAEMRAGSGMFLQAGVLELHDGEMELEGMEHSYSFDPPLGSIPVPTDLRDRWGWLHPATFRNLGLSPRFGVSAALAAEMWAAAGGGTVDGVVALDPYALRGVLRATGPVTVDGVRVDAEGVVDLLLHEQYLGENGADDSERYELLGAIASATLEALSAGNVDAAVLADELATAARGRHFMVWAADPSVRAVWEDAGVAGTIDERSLMVSLLNRGANKLDYFTYVNGSIEVEEAGRGMLTVAVRVRIANRTPTGLPNYVAGPYYELPLDYGDYSGILAVTLPGAAQNGRIDGEERLAAAGPDGPTRVVATRVELGRDTERELVIRFEVPAEELEVRVEPSARPLPIHWQYRGDEWYDEEPVDIVLRP